MGRPKKVPDIRGAEALADIRNAFAERDRRMQEFEDSIEPQRHAIRLECEADILTAIAAARTTPSLSKRSIMHAARAMNWDRWKQWEQRTDPLLSEYRPSWVSEIIERELTMDEFHAMRVDGYVFIKPTDLRAFKMLSLKYPHLEKARANDPGNDVILYWPDKPLYDGHWERMTDNNPAWANNPGAPLGEHREAIVKAVLGWVGESGGETP